MHRKFGLLLFVATASGFVALADGCTGPFWTGGVEGCCPTDPKDPGWDDDDCVEGRQWMAYMEDAGIDGAGCSPPMWPSSELNTDEVLETVCIPNAPDNFHPPQPLWVGPRNEDPGCLAEIGAFGDRRFKDLVVPPPSCPECVCGPIEGSCSARPNSIHLRTDYCDVLQTYTSDFSAPENWDGSCTNLHAMPANAECPENSGVPCAKAIYTSSLLDPVEGCKPIAVPIPSLYSDSITWENSVISCNATRVDLACPDHDSVRFAALPKNWRHCVRHQEKGIHECPSGSKYVNQIIAYEDRGYTDTRQCTECGCKAGGGSCYGTFNVYEDEQCMNFLSMNSINSETSDCANFPPGVAVGSKELVDLTYIPGKCEPTGGIFLGNVEKNDSEATTWCCMDAASAPVE